MRNERQLLVPDLQPCTEQMTTTDVYAAMERERYLEDAQVALDQVDKPELVRAALVKKYGELPGVALLDLGLRRLFGK